MITARDITQEPTDRAFVQGHIDRLPRTWVANVADIYRDKASASRRDANLYLMDVADEFDGLGRAQVLTSGNDEDVRAFAKERAEQSFRIAARFKVIEFAAGWLRIYALRYGVEPPSGDNVTPRGIVGRLTSERWWRRKIRRALVRNIEAAAIRSGFVSRRAGLYVSDEALRRRAGQRKRNSEILASIVAENDAGQTYTLQELSDLGVSNPELRRAELMTRIAGFDKLAIERGHAAEFYTLTAPSKYHARHHITGQENPSYNGATPAETQAYLRTVWARSRSALHRAGIHIYGVRVAEPHHDGTPHWHMILFCEPGRVKELRAILKRYALAEEGDEPGADKHRFKYEAIDRAKGSAASYVAKYIAKNIDGHGVGEDYEARSGHDAAMETAKRVDAWAATWGIRQFQQIGGQSVTLWRELRRIDPNAVEGDYFYGIVKAADAGEWDVYTKLNGGEFKGIAIAQLEKMSAYDHNSGEPVRFNVYGEPAAPKVIGVYCLGETIETHAAVWVFKRGGEAATPWSPVNNCTAAQKEIDPQGIAIMQKAYDTWQRSLPKAEFIPPVADGYIWLEGEELARWRDEREKDRHHGRGGG